MSKLTELQSDINKLREQKTARIAKNNKANNEIYDLQNKIDQARYAEKAAKREKVIKRLEKIRKLYKGSDHDYVLPFGSKMAQNDLIFVAPKQPLWRGGSYTLGTDSGLLSIGSNKFLKILAKREKLNEKLKSVIEDLQDINVKLIGSSTKKELAIIAKYTRIKNNENSK